MKDELVLPDALGEERAVLAAILMHNPVYDRVAADLTPADFRDPRHRAVFVAMAEMNGTGMDLLTVTDHLRTAGALEAAGGSTFVSSLIDGMIPDIAGVHRYVKIVRDASLRRKAIMESRRVHVAAMSGMPVSELAADAAMTFADIATTRDSGPLSIAEMARRGEGRLEERMTSKRALTGVAMGFSRIDRYTLGIQRGVETLLCARPRVGKTTTTLSIVRNILRDGGRVLMFQLDMSEEMIYDRMLSGVAGVPCDKVRTMRGLSSDEMARIASANAQMRRLAERLVIDYTTRDIGRVAAIVRREHRAGDLALVIVDHIGHLENGKGEKRYLQVGDLSRRLIDLAKATNVGMLSLVQLNRDAADRKPSLEDIRESGNLEQDARMVMLLDRPEMRGDEDAEGRAYRECDLMIAIPKNEGHAGSEFRMHFALDLQHVSDGVEGYCAICGESGSAWTPETEDMFANSGA